MSTALRLATVSFCCDFGLYVIMSALPFRLLEFGAGSLMLGAAPAFYAAPYSGLVLFFGRRGDSVPRARLIRVGVVIAALGSWVLSRGNSAWSTILCIPILSLGLSLVWPAVQAGFAEIHEGQRLSRQVGIYNLSWSCGKGFGFLIGGTLIVTFGTAQSFLVAAAAYAVAALVIPDLRLAGHHKIESPRGREPIRSQERRAFLRSAWWINGIAFGVGAVFNHHLPKILVARGEDAARFGQLLGAIFLAQMLSFLLLARWTSWHYRLRELVLLQGVLAFLAIAMVGWSLLPLLFVGAIALGAILGFSYQSSLYYSLHAETGRGRQAGIHEASLGVASALLPFAGGIAAQASGDLRAPFALASIVVLGVLAFTTLRIRSARRI